MSSERIIDLYERNAGDFDRERGRSLQEKAWLDAFLSHVPPTGIVLDIGCGMAEPIARYIIERGFGVAGVDSSPSLIDLCRARFPQGEWLVADMRHLAVGRRFDGRRVGQLLPSDDGGSARDVRAFCRARASGRAADAGRVSTVAGIERLLRHDLRGPTIPIADTTRCGWRNTRVQIRLFG